MEHIIQVEDASLRGNAMKRYSSRVPYSPLNNLALEIITLIAIISLSALRELIDDRSTVEP